MKNLLAKLGPILALIAVYAIFAALAPESFRSVRSLETILRQTTIVGIASLGMTLVMISGGIDLSVGSLVALSTVAVAWVLQAGHNPWLALLAGVLICALCGAFNGFLITRLRVVPFIVTLGTLLVVRGLAKGIAHEQKIDAPLCWIVDLLSELGPDQKWMLFPIGVWVTIALAGVTDFLLKFTRFGKHLFAIGSNEQTARLCGVAVDRVKWIVYILVGAYTGLAGVMQFSRLTVGDPTVAVGLELDIIASVVIGGGSLSGGEGTGIGTLVGALIMTVIRAGCAQMGLPNWVQEIVTGSVIVLAVALDRWRHRQEANA